MVTPRLTPRPPQREIFRDARGRFRRATGEEALASDVRAGTAEYYRRRLAGGRQFATFRGRRSGQTFAIRRGRLVPLGQDQLRIIVDDAAGDAARFFLDEVVLQSPVDTGLLQSRWTLRRYQVSNDTPYLPAVMRRNPFVSESFNETLDYLRRRNPSSRRRPPRIVKTL